MATTERGPPGNTRKEWREGRARQWRDALCRVRTQALATTERGPPDVRLSIMPYQDVHLSLKGPFRGIGAQIRTHGIATDILPLITIAFAPPELRVPE